MVGQLREAVRLEQDLRLAVEEARAVRLDRSEGLDVGRRDREDPAEAA
jgi:hypothetical protein